MTQERIPINLFDGDTLLLDNSSMEKFQTCPRSAQYAICQRRRTSGVRAPLFAGGVAHEALELRYRAGLPGYAQTPEVEAAMIQKATDMYADWIPPENEYRNLDLVVSMIHEYGKNYPTEEFEVLTMPDGKPFIEIPFAFPLAEFQVNSEMYVQALKRAPDGTFVNDGEPAMQQVTTIKVLWIGKIDLGYTSYGGLYIMDHKTSSVATNMAEFEISHQFYGYATAAEEILNREVSGIVINRIVWRRPTRTGRAYTFERKLIPVQRGILTEWRENVTHMVYNFIEMVRRSHMPKHTAWCVGKFGQCEYHKVCTLDSDDQKRMMLASGEYATNDWNPLK